MNTIHVLPFEMADGPHNMAADERMLELAAQGTASLRFYGWVEPTVSLGYFQPHQVREADSSLERLPFVRRPTGGAMLVHHHELTYAIGLPAEFVASTPAPWLSRMHSIIATALERLGVPVQSSGGIISESQALCFRQSTSGDLLAGGCKVTGSAQRKQRGALLQHGAVLLARSPFAPVLPGILELTGKKLHVESLAEGILDAWSRETGMSIERRDWNASDRQRVEELAARKYAGEAWNCKR